MSKLIGNQEFAGDVFIQGVGGYDGTNPESAETLSEITNNNISITKIKEISKRTYDEISLKEEDTLYCVRITFMGYGLGNGPVLQSGIQMPAETWKYYDDTSSYFAPQTSSSYREEPYSTPQMWSYMRDSDFWHIMINGGSGRVGSTVNGNENSYYSIIQVSTTITGGNTCNGLLLFPDYFSISGKTLQSINSSFINVGFTEQDLSVYLNQGCVFMPALGYKNGNTCTNLGEIGYYLCSNFDSSSKCLCLKFGDGNTTPGICEMPRNTSNSMQYTIWHSNGKAKHRYFKGNKEITLKEAVNEVKHLLTQKPKIKKYNEWVSLYHPLINFGDAEFVLLRYNKKYRKYEEEAEAYVYSRKGYSILQGEHDGWNKEYFFVLGDGQMSTGVANFSIETLRAFFEDYAVGLHRAEYFTYGFALRIPNPDYEGFPTGNKNNTYRGQCESLYSDIQRIALRYDDLQDDFCIGII